MSHDRHVFQNWNGAQVSDAHGRCPLKSRGESGVSCFDSSELLSAMEPRPGQSANQR